MHDVEIFPKALITAARTFAAKPAVVGEVLVALCTGDGAKRLTDVQRYILAACRDEIAARRSKREAATARKRRQRAEGTRQ